MAEEFTASCPCGYRTPLLTTAPHHEPATCDRCNSVVNAKRPSFRFDYENCPNCDSTINSKCFWGGGWFVTDRPSRIPCPRCHDNNLILHSISHMDFAPCNEIPSVNDIVHCELQVKGKVFIPDTYTESAMIWFRKTPRLSIGTRISARVCDVKTRPPVDPIARDRYHTAIRELELDFIDQLNGG
ncbi:hypothetical protein Rcae01_06808 [Novipirellula caenicola]|uniref:Uncharacterized protein n=1 Tax=Novipirellula caenicola TaxID=1536901 RepID=A0ABP9W1N8_9BACT